MEKNILREALGGRPFINSLQLEILNLVRGHLTQDKRDISNGGHRKFYARLGDKGVVGNIMSSTLDQILTAYISLFKGGIAPDTFSEREAEDLKTFVSSRYGLLYDVMEGIASKRKNPLGTELTNEQVDTLLRDTLRSCLDPDHQINIRIGIGGTAEKEVLPRIGAYLMHGLDIMAIYREAQNSCPHAFKITPPTMTVVSGAAMATAINGLDADLGKRNEQNIFRFLQKFVSTFYPELEQQVSFSGPDRKELFDNDLYEHLLTAATEIVGSTAVEHPASLARSQAHASFSILQRFATRRIKEGEETSSASEKALRYAIAQFLPNVLGGAKEGGVIRSGGESERHFNNFFEALYLALRARDENAELPFQRGINMISTVGGDPPPYYKCSNFDPDLREFVATAGDSLVKRLEEGRACPNYKRRGTIADYHILLTHQRMGHAANLSSGLHRYQDFLKHCVIA